jgi:hypothetical protein
VLASFNGKTRRTKVSAQHVRITFKTWRTKVSAPHNPSTQVQCFYWGFCSASAFFLASERT